jgi:hypothetical protein
LCSQQYEASMPFPDIFVVLSIPSKLDQLWASRTDGTCRDRQVHPTATCPYKLGLEGMRPVLDGRNVLAQKKPSSPRGSYDSQTGKKAWPGIKSGSLSGSQSGSQEGDE